MLSEAKACASPFPEYALLQDGPRKGTPGSRSVLRSRAVASGQRALG